MIPHSFAEYFAWAIILLAFYGTWRLATDVTGWYYKKQYWSLQRENQRRWRELMEQKIALRKAQKAAGQTENLEELDII